MVVAEMLYGLERPARAQLACLFTEVLRNAPRVSQRVSSPQQARPVSISSSSSSLRRQRIWTQAG
eukprot:7185555-Alexandrium_andersonii.AAC.1